MGSLGGVISTTSASSGFSGDRAVSSPVGDGFSHRSTLCQGSFLGVPKGYPFYDGHKNRATWFRLS